MSRFQQEDLSYSLWLKISPSSTQCTSILYSISKKYSIFPWTLLTKAMNYWRDSTTSSIILQRIFIKMWQGDSSKRIKPYLALWLQHRSIDRLEWYLNSYGLYLQKDLHPAINRNTFKILQRNFLVKEAGKWQITFKIISLSSQD